MEGEEFKPGHSVTAADAVELDALVVVDVKPAVLGDCEQSLGMEKVDVPHRFHDVDLTHELLCHPVQGSHVTPTPS